MVHRSLFPPLLIAGAMAVGGSAYLYMSGCTVSGNKTSKCGGVQFGGSVTATLENCRIAGNSAVGAAGGLYSEAAGGKVTLTSCTIENNSASGAGRGLLSTNNAKFTLTDCTFEQGQDISITGTGLLSLDGTCVFKAPVIATPFNKFSTFFLDILYSF